MDIYARTALADLLGKIHNGVRGSCCKKLWQLLSLRIASANSPKQRCLIALRCVDLGRENVGCEIRPAVLYYPLLRHRIGGFVLLGLASRRLKNAANNRIAALWLCVIARLKEG